MLAIPDEVAVRTMLSFTEPEVWKLPILQEPALAVYQPNKREGEEAWLKTMFPRLGYRIMPGVGHFLMLERPADFNGLLQDWLRQHSF